MDNFFNKGDLYLKEVIHPLIPNVSLGSYHFVNDGLRIELFGPGHLDKSIYSLEFIDHIYLLHFTSVSNLFHIVRDKKIHMSDFNIFRDEQEFYFAQKNAKDIKNEFIKSELFALSLCENTERVLSDDFMWNNYGKGHKGVCIKLKIHRDKGFFNDFYLSKILYKEEKNDIKELVELKERHEVFNLKYGWAISNLDEVLFSVYSMYKREIPYKDEKEIRLLKRIKKLQEAPHNTDEPIRYQYNEMANALNYIYELPLENEDQHYRSPFISIEQIFIGKKIHGVALGNIVNIIKSEFDSSFDRKVVISPLWYS